MNNNHDNTSEENFLPGMERKNPFVLPEGYFEEFSARLMNRIELEEELKEHPTLATLNRKLKLSVPENYFKNLENVLTYKYEMFVYSELNKIPKLTPSQPSADYFENLDKKIIEKLEQASELEEFSMLSSLEKKNSFSVKPGYFEQNEQIAEGKYQEQKRVSFGIIRKLSSTVFQPKFAIAASIALIIGFAAFWYLNQADSPIQNSDCKTLACLEKHELLNEKNINDFDDDNLYEMVDVEELDKNVSGENAESDSIKKNVKE